MSLAILTSTLEKHSEAKALTQVLAGDLAGLRVLYDLHASTLLNQAWRLLQAREAAEDAVHDLFLRLPEILSQFRGESSLRTWLFRAMHNQCLNVLSVAGHRRHLLQREWNAGDETSPEPSAAAVLEIQDTLHRAMSQLEPETRSLLWLKEAEGLSIKELSVIFNEVEGTIKARLSRARERLRHILAKETTHG